MYLDIFTRCRNCNKTLIDCSCKTGAIISVSRGKSIVMEELSGKLSILKFEEIAKKASNIGVSKKTYKQSDVGRIVNVIREMGYSILKRNYIEEVLIEIYYELECHKENGAPVNEDVLDNIKHSIKNITGKDV